MKANPKMFALIAMMSTSAYAQSNAAVVQMQDQCVKQIQSGVDMIVEGGSGYDSDGNPTAIDPKSYAGVVIDNVKVVKSACLGPAECDAQNPDFFVYTANITYTDMQIAGRVKVSYHRGNCSIQKLELGKTK